MPEQARTRRAPGERAWWGFQEELLAQLVELTSVYAADRRLAEPLAVPRPNTVRAADTAPSPPSSGTSGLRQLLDAASLRGRVQHG
ncbi:hypothetical protein [Kitasatospora sp. NPDC094016]|uniref:hypothetical protein n=1 Tax=Kitasatospora sp. NPDC094016 TaxID=3154986 RepID=UPI003328E6C1